MPLSVFDVVFVCEPRQPVEPRIDSRLSDVDDESLSPKNSASTPGAPKPSIGRAAKPAARTARMKQPARSAPLNLASRSRFSASSTNVSRSSGRNGVWDLLVEVGVDCQHRNCGR